MSERPILFSAPMVRAILAGKKHQTRRVMTPQPVRSLPNTTRDAIADGIDLYHPQGWKWRNAFVADGYPDHDFATFIAHKGPFGRPGDRLWVRETWRTYERPDDNVDGIRFYADDAFVPIANTREAGDDWVQVHQRDGKWRPSIHMPRWASRITLEVTAVRAERLQEISATDALSEGVGETAAWRPKDVDENPKPTHEWAEPYWDDYYFWNRYPQRAFAELWDSINGKRAPWASNPWVWVVAFEMKGG